MTKDDPFLRPGGRLAGFTGLAASATLASLALAHAGCGAPLDPAAPEVTETEAPVFAARALWNNNQLGTGATIPVCFTVNPVRFPDGHVICPTQHSANVDCAGKTSSTRGDGVIIPFNPNTVRAIVKDGVEATWSRYANLDFTGWGDCPSVADPTFQRVTVLTNLPSTIVVTLTDGDASGIGKSTSVATHMVLNWGPTVSVPPGIPIDLNYAHEFGHALGFPHEWSRLDYVIANSINVRNGGSCVPDTGEFHNANGTEFLLTPGPDYVSIMDKCHPIPLTGPPILSAGDIAGVRKAYGNRTIGGTVGHRLDYFFCARENENCAVGGSKYVAYGAAGGFVYKAMSGQFACTTGNFGGVDPAPGIVKSCYFANYQFRLNENQSGSAGVGARDIAFGANGKFNFKSVGASYTCNVGTFGDPLPGVVKACYSAMPGYLPGATDNGTMTGLNQTPVAYGANGRFIHTILSGTQSCTPATFGFDPVPGVLKTCYRMTLGPLIADEGQGFNVGNGTVYRGSGLNGNFFPGPASGVCTSATFGQADPDPGVPKHCYGAPLP